MHIKLILISLILILAGVSFQHFYLPLTNTLHNIQIVIINTTDNFTDTIKSDIDNKIDTGKKTVMTTVAQTLGETTNQKDSKILGVTAPKKIELNKVKIDYNQKNITNELEPFEVTIPENTNNWTLNIYASKFQSEYSTIEEKYLKVTIQTITDRSGVTITEGNPLILQFHGPKNPTSKKINIYPLLKIDLPPGLYKGTYTGKIYWDVTY